jgi:hypothetical protein
MRVRKPDIWDVIARGDVVELRTYFRDGKSANRVDRVCPSRNRSLMLKSKS